MILLLAVAYLVMYAVLWGIHATGGHNDPLAVGLSCVGSITGLTLATTVILKVAF